jgi:hypothetical protein
MANTTATVTLELRSGATSIDITKSMKRFRWTDSLLRGGFSWALDFNTESWEDWTDLLLGKDTEAFRFRLVTQEGDVQAATEWRRAYVEGSKSAFRGQALEASVFGADKALNLRAQARTRAWPASTVAEVVSAIAKDYDLEAVVDGTLGRRDRWQLQEDDWSFISRLVAQTSNESGRGDLYLWVDEDRLYLTAPDLAVPSDRRHDLAQQETRVNRVVVGYAGREVDRKGGARMRAIGYDLDAFKPLVFTVDEEATSTQPTLARRVPRAQSGDLRIEYVAEEGIDLVEAQARARWGKFGPRYFSLRLDTKPDILLRPGTIIEAQVNLDGDRQTPLLGRFLCVEVEHNMIGGGLETTVVCYRREAFEGEEEPTGASASSGATRDRYQLGEGDAPRTILTAEVLE